MTYWLISGTKRWTKRKIIGHGLGERMKIARNFFPVNIVIKQGVCFSRFCNCIIKEETNKDIEKKTVNQKDQKKTWIHIKSAVCEFIPGNKSFPMCVLPHVDYECCCAWIKEESAFPHHSSFRIIIRCNHIQSTCVSVHCNGTTQYLFLKLNFQWILETEMCHMFQWIIVIRKE